MAYLLSQLAEFLDGRVVGDDIEINGIASLDEAAPGDLAFMENARMLPYAERSAASALLVPADITVPGKSTIQVSNPRIAFAGALSLFSPDRPIEPSIHPTAIIGEGAQVAPTATVMAHAVVGARSVIGEGAVVYPLAYVGDEVVLGSDTLLFPNVTVYDRVTIGSRVRIHSGAVVGADGFGYERENGRHLKVPHIGTVVIEDDVEVGACCTIDRAKTGATRIGRGTKIDNLVQIAHNCQIGANCIIVAQVGLCGSVRMGDYVVVAGQSAVGEHRVVGSGARLGGRAGVLTDVPDGETYSGFPARPHMQWLKTQAALQKMPEALNRMREMERRIEELERKIEVLSEESMRPESDGYAISSLA